MGVDDEYRAVSATEDSSEHLLEKSGGPITRAAYKKRSMAASLVIGALIGAAATFVLSLVLGTPNTSLNRATPTQTAAITSADAVLAATSAAAVATPTQAAEHKTQTNDDDDDNEILTCGSTPDEARAKGCIFDVMMQDWTPAPCYDKVLSDRYLAAGNWTWWADVDAEKTFTLDEMRQGEHTVIYAIQDYHRQHCIFAWEKMVRALRNDWPLIEELISYDHVMHCKHTTLSKNDDNIRGVRAPTAYTRCAKYKTWNHGNFPANSVSSVDK